MLVDVSLEDDSMNIAVIGLGYVGSVSTGCLAKLRHRVIGVDVDASKIGKMANGQAPIVEPGLADLMAVGHVEGRITATHNMDYAIANTDVAFLAVGTPSRKDGGIDDSYLVQAVTAIGHAIRKSGKSSYVLMSRSTSLPPVHRKLMEILEQTSGLSYDDGLGYVCHPEFLREGTAIEDFDEPPKIVFGVHGEACRSHCESLYPGIDAPTFFTEVDTAAMVKYADNCFHAVKVTFGNEMGMICRTMGVDSHAVMDLFCADRKLNISARYLRPGTPFGGSCLPKDLRGILHAADESDTPLKMLGGTYESNKEQIDALMERVTESTPKVVGIVGLSFKVGTPDLRESPTLELLNRLKDQGIKVIAYDEELAKLEIETDEKHGGELDPIADLRSHLTDDLDAMVHDANVLLVYHSLDKKRWEKVEYNGGRIIDMTNIGPLRRSDHYEGLYW
jgi:GDP-mannose 6-dehydrogenase